MLALVKYTVGLDYYSLDNYTHLLIWWSALVICISYVVFAENFFTGITFHGKKICSVNTGHYEKTKTVLYLN